MLGKIQKGSLCFTYPHFLLPMLIGLPFLWWLKRLDFLSINESRSETDYVTKLTFDSMLSLLCSSEEIFLFSGFWTLALTFSLESGSIALFLWWRNFESSSILFSRLLFECPCETVLKRFLLGEFFNCNQKYKNIVKTFGLTRSVCGKILISNISLLVGFRNWKNIIKSNNAINLKLAFSLVIGTFWFFPLILENSLFVFSLIFSLPWEVVLKVFLNGGFCN